MTPFQAAEFCGQPAPEWMNIAGCSVIALVLIGCVVSFFLLIRNA